MNRFALAPMAILLSLTLAGCPGSDDEKPTDTEDTDASDTEDTEPSDTEPSDTEEPTDPNLTADQDNADRYTETVEYTYEYDVDGTGTADDDKWSGMTGELTYRYAVDGVDICNAAIDLTGTAYTGDCNGCDWAFDMDATITSEAGTKDCEYPNVVTFVENAIEVDPVLAYWGTYSGYYGDYYKILQTGRSIDYSTYGGGFYEGPYWWTWTYSTDPKTDPAGYGSVEVSGTSFEWGFNTGEQDYTTTDANYYEYCSYVYWSYAGGGYSSDGTNEATGAVDCDGEIVDTYTVDVAAGDTVYITVDTTGADTAFDPWFYVNDSTGCTVATADDNFDCTFPPTDWQCPSLAWSADTAGTYEIVVGSWGYCTGKTAEYELLVMAESE